MPKRPFLLLLLPCLVLFAGCGGGASSTIVTTPTGPRPAVSLSVYLETNYPQTTTSGYDTVYALNASDGSKRWQHNTGQNFQGFTLGDIVLYLPVDGVVHAIDTSTNKDLWTYKTGDQSGALVVNGRAYLTLPTADQQHTNVLALDANTGATLWHTEVAAEKILGVFPTRHIRGGRRRRLPVWWV